MNEFKFVIMTKSSKNRSKMVRFIHRLIPCAISCRAVQLKVIHVMKPMANFADLMNSSLHGGANVTPATPGISSGIGGITCPESPPPISDQEKLLRRQMVTIRRRTIEVRNRHGQLLDPEKFSFLLDVCKELDRQLLRTVKDTILPPNYVNYKDANGTVSVILVIIIFR